MWVVLAGLFAVWLYYHYGHEAAYQFVSGYLIEKSLSVDNLFIFTLIFASFGIKAKDQGKYLAWGIIGAFILRGLLIFAGAALVAKFHWILYIFGAFLIYTSLKLLKAEDGDAEPPALVDWLKQRFSLFWAVVLSIEFSDIIFALDSIPATFAVTQDPIIVYSSNMFAIMGLRSLYFVLTDLMSKFENLKYGVSAVLGFIGIKILISGFYEIPTPVSLLVTALMLGISIMWKGKTNDYLEESQENLR